MTNIKQPRAAQAVPETSFQEFRHRQIAMRYAWQERDRRARRRPPQFCYLRLRQLERIYADRHGASLPDDRAGHDALFVALHHIAQADEPEDVRRSNMLAWSMLWCPWFDEEECAAAIARVLADPVKWSANTLGWRLRLMDADRTRLKVTTIAPIDCTKTERAQRSKERRNATKRAQRAAKRPISAACSKPWELEGISRATWYRRGRNETVRQIPAEADRATSNASADNSLTGANPPPPNTAAAAIPFFTPRGRVIAAYAARVAYRRPPP